MNKISQPLANITNKENIEYPSFKTVQSKSAIYESARQEEISYRAPQSTYIKRPLSEIVQRPSSVGYIPQKTPTLFWVISILLVILLIGALMIKSTRPSQVDETPVQSQILVEIISDSLQRLVKISGKVSIQQQFEELKTFYGEEFDPFIWVQIKACLSEKFQIQDDGQGHWYY